MIPLSFFLFFFNLHGKRTHRHKDKQYGWPVPLPVILRVSHENSFSGKFKKAFKKGSANLLIRSSIFIVRKKKKKKRNSKSTERLVYEKKRLKIDDCITLISLCNRP